MKMDKKKLEQSKENVKLDIINLDGRRNPDMAIKKIAQFDEHKIPGRKGRDTFRDGLARAGLVDQVNAIYKINRYVNRLKKNHRGYQAKYFRAGFNRLVLMPGHFARNIDGQHFHKVDHGDINKLVDVTKSQFGLPHHKVGITEQHDLERKSYMKMPAFRPRHTGNHKQKFVGFRRTNMLKPKAQRMKELKAIKRQHNIDRS